MKTYFFLAVASAICIGTQCRPNYFDNGMIVRSRRSPDSSMLYTGYYSHPPVDQRYEPHDPDCKSCGGEYLVPSEGVSSDLESTTQIAEDYPHVLIPQAPERPVTEEAITEVVQAPQVPKVEEASQKEVQKPPKKNTKEEEEDSDDWPISKPGTKNRQFLNFFPVMFGGYMGRSLSGGATAIANSFSTGKGGVATSHATAFGDPTGALRNNANWNTKARYPPQI